MSIPVHTSRPAATVAVLAVLTAVAWATGNTSPVAAAPALSGKATVISADRIAIAGTDIRLWGIDALEPEQICHRTGKPWACGKKALDHLKSFINGHIVTCVPGTAATGTGGAQITAKCALGSLDLAAEMIGRGHALPDTPESKKYYGQLFREARGQGAGMFSGTFVTPRDWRAGKR